MTSASAVSRQLGRLNIVVCNNQKREGVRVKAARGGQVRVSVDLSAALERAEMTDRVSWALESLGYDVIKLAGHPHRFWVK